MRKLVKDEVPVKGLYYGIELLGLYDEILATDGSIFIHFSNEVGNFHATKFKSKIENIKHKCKVKDRSQTVYEYHFENFNELIKFAKRKHNQHQKKSLFSFIIKCLLWLDENKIKGV